MEYDKTHRVDLGRKKDDDYSEIFAKSIEYGEVGSNNKLAKEIYRMVKEGDLP